MSDITIYEGQIPQIAEYQEPSQVDATFLDLWLDGKSEKTERAYRAEINAFYAYVGKPLCEVTLQDVQQFRKSLAHLKPTSRNRAVAAVKSALSFGLKSGYLAVNVGLLVKLEKLEDTLAERIMSEQAIARMLALETNKRNHAILVLLYRGGLRCAELCSLTRHNLQERNEQTGQITVYGKGNKTRAVLLTQETWEEVMDLKTGHNEDSYVFQSRQSRSRTNKADRRMDESTVFRIVQAAAARAGITGNVSPHWMRHAHATHALENGAPITLVKETLGHKSIETTSKYTHVRPNTSSGQYLKV
jgi:integrase/recombinase XerD